MGNIVKKVINSLLIIGIRKINEKILIYIYKDFVGIVNLINPGNIVTLILGNT